MKKLISLALVLVMLFTLAAPVGAASYKVDGSPIPVVTIYGDGEAIYDAEKKVKLFQFNEIMNIFGGSEEGALGEAAVNILMPFLLEGIINDEWDNYYAALEKEVGELFTEVRYDENGENWNGSGLSQHTVDLTKWQLSRDAKLSRGGYYHYADYHFFYDWRQDPMKTADEFHEYVEAVKRITGAEKVAVIARCLGTSVVMAYLKKYGNDSIHGVSFNGSVAAGGEIISEPISGKFVLDVNAINRMLADFGAIGWFELDSFITSSIDLAAKTLTAMNFDFNETEIYGKLVHGVTSALALSTFFTWPGYWALVCEDDFDDALLYVFGEEGSAKREKYKNLITKIEDYHYNVMTEIDTVFQSLRDDRVKVGVIAKYGFQLAAIAESRDYVADQFATVEKASFGATTSTVYEPLDAEYIAAREAEGKGKYISPDKRIDASTCAFPDSTWFTKGITHSNWTEFETSVLLAVVTADRQLTVDDFEYTQFIVYDNETQTAYPMTEDNCNTEVWSANKNLDKPEDKHGIIFSAVYSLIKWVMEFFRFIMSKIG
ncbi:MAG: hypothetical protein IJN88_05995 [Clostridia bacterium]|nr:hypothetical protein [Clostridia bacterium]